MVCDVCSKGVPVHKYILDDGSAADICDDCGKILYGRNIKHKQPGRLFELIAMIEFVKYVKRLRTDTNIYHENEHVKRIAM